MNKLIALIFGLLVLAVLASLFVFTIDEKQTAVKLKFGEVVQAGYEPGLHFKLPIVNNIVKFDSRIQTLDNAPERVFNTDNEYLMVDYFVKWRIKDVKTFFTSNAGLIAKANANLTGVVKNALQEEFSVRTLDQAISSQRIELMESLRSQTKARSEDYGLEIVDVRIKQINLDQSVNESVYNRMRSERLVEAAEHRSTGRKESINIRANTDKKIRIMLADADKKAAIMRGEGDAEATKLFAESHNKNPEFYSFVRSLEAYMNSFQAGSGNVLVLDPDSEFFKYFNGQSTID
ncbi:protease modulator HflC [Marinicella litoralis]|uniref:Protein HflC n=1 Tax=Marinicella litoralis TaxID=644220 RepID=A0A4R6XVD7_9GAMM|nr:protease modulator HflC [Marinicella litoralis]TDR23796.1 protease FtsH subunit HflC [Marinicella litoralis]